MDLWEKFRQFQERTQRAGEQMHQRPHPGGQPGQPARVGIELRPEAREKDLRREVEAVLGLEREDTPAGPCYFREVHYPASHRHGHLTLGSFLALPPEGLGILALPPVALPPPSWVFLDTETTGLQGGPGTIVFLCGLAYFAGGNLVLRQYLAPDPTAEPALICSVLRDIGRFSGLVSFNGKAFDWPLIRDRVVLARQIIPPDPVHADLLFAARWLFRSRLSSCRLCNLEAEILRCPREDDIPSELIPEVYRAYLRGAPANTLAPVLEHNRRDLLTLVVLACRLLSPWLQAEQAEPEELYGLARMLWARGYASEAVSLWERAVARLPRVLAARAGEELGRIYRRQGRPHEAARIWQAVAGDDPLAHPGPLVELAKYYEHTARDLEAARQWTLRALDAARARAALHASPVRGASPAELLHRLRRLERKLATR